MGICSSIVDIKVENSPLQEKKWTNLLKNKSHCKLVRHKVKIKQTKICVICCSWDLENIWEDREGCIPNIIIKTALFAVLKLDSEYHKDCTIAFKFMDCK